MTPIYEGHPAAEPRNSITLFDFVEDRLDEDEERASSGWSDLREERWENTDEGRSVLTPRAVLADIAAKRQMIEHARRIEREPFQGDMLRADEQEKEAGRIIRDIVLGFARTWSDHADFHPAWRTA